MPIKGLTDEKSLVPQFPRLGKLRKGGPKGASGFGKDLTYFRFTSDRPEIEAAFFEAYGKKPQILQPVYLPYPDALQNFPSWREEWKAGGLQHRCDEVTCNVSRKGSGYTTEAVPCPYASQPENKKGCKPVGRLSIVLPKLIKAGYVGYVTLETHSKHDLMGITSVLLAVGQSPQGIGGIPFELRRYEAEVSTPGSGNKRVRRKKWLVALVPEPSFVECQLALARQTAYSGLLPMGEATALPAPQVEDAEFDLVPQPDSDPAPQSDSNPASDPEPEQPQDAVNKVSVEWALGVAVGDRTMAEAKEANLNYILLNQDEYSQVQVKAARILSHADAAPFVARWREEQENIEPSIEANEQPVDDIPF